MAEESGCWRERERESKLERVREGERESGFAHGAFN